MLIVLGRNKKNNSGNTKLNLTGVARQSITGNKIIDTNNLHTHEDTETGYIDHTVNDTRKVVRNIFVVNADPTR